MPTNVPNWLIGKHLTTCAILPMKADSAGALTNSAVGSQNILTIIDDIDYAGQLVTEEISALTAVRENAVPIEQDDVLTLTQILRSGAGLNLLAASWMASDSPEFAQFTFAWGGNTCVMVGTMAGYEEDVEKGKSVCRMTLRMTDIGTGSNVNPVYS